jgi:hypothetical protein
MVLDCLQTFARQVSLLMARGCCALSKMAIDKDCYLDHPMEKAPGILPRSTKIGTEGLHEGGSCWKPAGARRANGKAINVTMQSNPETMIQRTNTRN